MSVPLTVVHVPHASTAIPEAIRPTLTLSDEELRREQLLMTDWHTDSLFAVPSELAATVRFPVSRLVVDPERFADDRAEPMASKGMGAVYTKTSDGKELRRRISDEERNALLNTYYYPHQERVRAAVGAAFAKHGRCLIIDAHSFSSQPLPHEPDQSPNRCQICIGTDDFHSPPWLVKLLMVSFASRGFTVALNRPFAGSFVPMDFYRRNPQVVSVMIEVNRSLYLDESNGAKSSDFGRFRSILGQMLTELAIAFVSEKDEESITLC